MEERHGATYPHLSQRVEPRGACLALKVPLVSVVIGEGGSGGAIALAAANAVLMLEHAIYSVISPEGCASILWRDAEGPPPRKIPGNGTLRAGVTAMKSGSRPRLPPN